MSVHAEASAIDLSGDGGVMKKVLTPGSGTEHPPQGYEVHGTFIDYGASDSVPAVGDGPS